VYRDDRTSRCLQRVNSSLKHKTKEKINSSSPRTEEPRPAEIDFQVPESVYDTQGSSQEQVKRKYR